MQDFTGQTHGRFEIIEKIAEGGMYTLFKANMEYHLPLVVNLKVFRKELNEHRDFALRFDRVASHLMKLNHQHILQIGESGDIEGHKYLTIQYREGQTLKEWLQNGPLELSIVRNSISQVGDALNYAHEIGFVHRDINPNNIWVGQDGHFWLMNFENFQLFAFMGNPDQGGAFLGNPLYYSPEQCLGENLDGRSDIYSLGLVLYEMVTGLKAYQADSIPILFLLKIQEPPPSAHQHSPEISEELDAVIRKSLATKREERYQTAGEMVAAVEGAIQE